MEPTDAEITLPAWVERSIEARYGDGAPEMKSALLGRMALNRTKDERSAIERAEELIRSRLNGDSERIISRLHQMIETRRLAHAEEAERSPSHILQNAKIIGADYFEASGEMPDWENFKRLHENGYGPAPEEVQSAIANLDDLQAEIGLFAVTRKAEEKTEKDAILIEIKDKIAGGELSRELFGNYKWTESEDGKEVARWVRGDISDEEKIKRYAKYKIARALLPGEVSGNKIDREKQCTSIALGINRHSDEAKGKRMPHTFVQEILCANSELGSAEDIRRTVVYMTWERYLFPEERGTYLNAVGNAGRKISPRGFTKEEILARAKEFVNRTGKIPTGTDHDSDPELSSRTTVIRHFSSLTDYQARVRELLDQEVA